MAEIKQLTMAELEAGLEEIRQSPNDNGVLEMIVRRSQIDEREILAEGELDLVAQDKPRWPLAGDQLCIDMDFSAEYLPPGTRLGLETAAIEVTVIPHNGCKKFMARFGLDALKFVNSPTGKQLHRRGINAKVVQSGVVRVGDKVKKV